MVALVLGIHFPVNGDLIAHQIQIQIGDPHALRHSGDSVVLCLGPVGSAGNADKDKLRAVLLAELLHILDVPYIFGGDTMGFLCGLHIVRCIGGFNLMECMIALVPPDMGIPHRFVPVLSPQRFPPVVIAQNRNPFPRYIREHLCTAVVRENRQGFQDHNLGALFPERAAQILFRLVQPLQRGPAHIGGDALFFPDLHRHEAAVAFTVAQEQYIDGILRLSQNAVCLGGMHSRLFGIVLWQNNIGSCRQQHRQDQKKCHR